MGCEQALNLALVPVVVRSDPRPSDVHHLYLSPLFDLLQERQEGKVSAVRRRLLAQLPVPVAVLEDFHGELEGQHQDSVRCRDVRLTLKVSYPGELLLFVHQADIGRLGGLGGKAQRCLRFLFAFLIVQADLFSERPIVVFHGHLRAIRHEAADFVRLLPVDLFAGCIAQDVLVLHLGVQVYEDGVGGDENREDVLLRLQLYARGGHPLAQALVVPHHAEGSDRIHCLTFHMEAHLGLRGPVGTPRLVPMRRLQRSVHLQPWMSALHHRESN
mmetsp:Transcript_117694/g.279427  ORF Transcript_117694/g.279427 Transcript_117694/m.279427 type:complete len:272 (-) Transcript_117694:6-821(-)